MNLNPMDLGVCGVEQVLHAGTVKFNSAGIAAGSILFVLPENTIITGAVVNISAAFNAATTNVLTVGKGTAFDDVFAAGELEEGKVGATTKNLWLECDVETKITAKYTQTGTAATTGEADVFLKVVRKPK
ncbi:MAG: hypothetical protein RR365_14095 [Bacteroides sp.]